MPEDTFAPDRVEAVAHELVDCRQRGLDWLDFADHRQHRIEVPLLTHLAHDYYRAKGQLFPSRPQAIRTLIVDGVRACDAQGYTDLSRFVGLAFFAKVDPRGTTGKKEGVQRIRRTKVMAAFGLSEADYDAAQFRTFTDFATFLLSFVAATVAETTVSAPEPSVSETGRPATDDAEVTDALASSETAESAATSVGRWQTWRAGVRQHRRAAGVVGTLALLLIVGLIIVLMRPGTQWPVSAGTTSLATSSVTGTTGASGPANGAQPGSTHTEIAGQFGAPTFADPHNPSVSGVRIKPYQQVQVACKVYAPTIPSASPDGYWYRIVSAPWNGRDYAVANTFMNGDKVGGPSLHNTDFAVPDCPSPPTG